MSVSLPVNHHVRFSGINETGLPLQPRERLSALGSANTKITPIDLKRFVSENTGFSEEHIRLHFKTYLYTPMGRFPVTEASITDASPLPDTWIREQPVQGVSLRSFIEFSLVKCNDRQHCHS